MGHYNGRVSDANAPVGVFDSGLGGLSVLREIQRLLPAEHVLYYGDSGHCPYGGRPPEYILGRSTAVTNFLVERGAKIIVVACNTATSVCIPELRARFSIPIVAMAPAVKPAAAATRSGKIGVLATPRTVTGESLAALIREHARDTEVYPMPAPGLVELVEAGKLSGPEVEDALRPLLGPLLEKGVDTIVLGCTHYPFLRDAICDLAGPGLAIIDSGEAVARRTRDVLTRQGLLRPGSGQGRLELFTSGTAEHVGQVASRLLGEKVTVAHAAVPPDVSI
ncbi:MAG: glutamate racemase [Chloroflexota bacterium]|nr:glutamate racemase [Chloroflexota bacterium]